MERNVILRKEACLQPTDPALILFFLGPARMNRILALVMRQGALDLRYSSALMIGSSEFEKSFGFLVRIMVAELFNAL